MPQFVVRFGLNEDTGSFDALAQALRRETGATSVLLDEELWIIPGQRGHGRRVTASFRGEEAALQAVRLWLDRLVGLGNIDLMANQVAVQIAFANGIECRRQGHNEDALEWYGRALAVDDSIGRVWSNRANVLHDLQRWEEADTSHRRAVECSPEDVSVRFNLGTFLIHRCRYAEAVAELREAVRLDPDLEPGKQNLEVAEGLLSSSGQTESAGA